MIGTETTVPAKTTNQVGEPTPAASMSRLVMPCADLIATVEFFCEHLDFRLDNIWPADSPAQAIVSSPGLHIELRLDTQSPSSSSRIIVVSDSVYDRGLRSMSAPNGAVVDVIRATAVVEVPLLQTSFVISQLDSDTSWVTGRAGMRYRDLIPDRQGGRFIASHIQIPDGGPVPDYVHFHDVRFQMIFCVNGWVELVYEDQGAPFVLLAGDCVLQPPRIRHRVLESSPGLEVVEIGCPAEHFDDASTSSSCRRTPFVRTVTSAGNDSSATSPRMRRTVRGVQLGWSVVTRASPVRRSDWPTLSSLVHSTATTATSSGRSATAASTCSCSFSVAKRRCTSMAGVFGLRRATSVVVPTGEQFSLSDISEDFEVIDISL